jgi:hypothetical protein
VIGQMSSWSSGGAAGSMPKRIASSWANSRITGGGGGPTSAWTVISIGLRSAR